MTPNEWKKVERYLTHMHTCPLCNEPIEASSEGKGVTYSKTKGGSHVFIHEACLQKITNKK